MTNTQGARTPEQADALNGIEARAAQSAVDGLPTTIADLSSLVRIPSVSWPSFGLENVQRSAEAVADLFRGTGVFDEVTVERAPVDDAPGELGNPAILARRNPRAGRPTILLYAHHDVQPPGDEAIWQTPPFEPTVRGDRLFGRGAADDKAGIMTHVASIRALVNAVGEPDLGLVIFVEGEEEFGSRSFSAFLREHQQKLAADVIVVADSGNWTPDIPALTVGLRGNVTFKLTVRTLDHALHSGMFGGSVPDAMLTTITLLSTLWTADGSVAVEGLSVYDGATPEYDEAQLREESGLLESSRPIGDGSVLSRIWSKPAITVIGIDAPTVANASNTLLPSVSVRISTRVAPGQPAQQAFEAVAAHLRSHAPFGALVEIDDVDVGDPFLVDTSGWAVAEAEKAMADAWGAEPVEMGVGGSIPFVADLVRTFPDAQILVTGVEDPDSRAHSPNESLHLGAFRKAILAETLLLTRLNSRDGAA